jgi:hypothetical protein
MLNQTLPALSGQCFSVSAALHIMAYNQESLPVFCALEEKL